MMMMMMMMIIIIIIIIGSFNKTVYELVGDLGKRISRLSSDDHESSFFVSSFVCGGATL